MCYTAPRRKGSGQHIPPGSAGTLYEGFGAVVEMDADGSHQPEQLRFLLAAAQGYSFQVDLTVRALRAGLVVVELPITFVGRAICTSKINGAIVVEALWRIT